MVLPRSLFWKIYVTLLASLVATSVMMGAFFWFLDEAQREAGVSRTGVDNVVHGPADVSVYGENGLVALRGKKVTLSDYAERRAGPNHVTRVDLPDGRFALMRYGPPGRARTLRILLIMLIAAGGVGLAAFPVTALLTRRLEALRAGVARWGDGGAPVTLDESGNDEVALLATTFNKAATRLAAMLASQKALLANASHELRSPLARLRVAIEVGRGGGAMHEEIVRNMAEIDQLVDELLLSSRLDHAGAHQDRRESIDLLGLAAEEASRFDAMVSGEPIEVRGDAILLRRLMRNLLENAAKHGRPPIAVSVSPWVRGGATIMISDEGKGIAAPERARIFEPFYRPHGFGEDSGGWGLGLALVRQIAERHGGTAACRAEASGGTSFVVTLAG